MVIHYINCKWRLKIFFVKIYPWCTLKMLHAPRWSLLLRPSTTVNQISMHVSEVIWMMLTIQFCFLSSRNKKHAFWFDCFKSETKLRVVFTPQIVVTPFFLSLKGELLNIIFLVAKTVSGELVLTACVEIRKIKVCLLSISHWVKPKISFDILYSFSWRLPLVSPNQIWTLSKSSRKE